MAHRNRKQQWGNQNQPAAATATVYAPPLAAGYKGRDTPATSAVTHTVPPIREPHASMYTANELPKTTTTAFTTNSTPVKSMTHYHRSRRPTRKTRLLFGALPPSPPPVPACLPG